MCSLRTIPAVVLALVSSAAAGPAFMILCKDFYGTGSNCFRDEIPNAAFVSGSSSIFDREETCLLALDGCPSAVEIQASEDVICTFGSEIVAGGSCGGTTLTIRDKDS
jgi:hypothetical protein